MNNRKQIFNISVTTQCNECKYSMPSDLFMGEYLCNNDIDNVILYPEFNGRKKCPHKEPSD